VVALVGPAGDQGRLVAAQRQAALEPLSPPVPADVFFFQAEDGIRDLVSAHRLCNITRDWSKIIVPLCSMCSQSSSFGWPMTCTFKPAPANRAITAADFSRLTCSTAPGSSLNNTASASSPRPLILMSRPQ